MKAFLSYVRTTFRRPFIRPAFKRLLFLCLFGILAIPIIFDGGGAAFAFSAALVVVAFAIVAGSLLRRAWRFGGEVLTSSD